MNKLNASSIHTLDNDLYSIDYFKNVDICRFCWGKNATTNLFNSCGTTVNERDLLEKIQYCLDISIDPTSIPNKICVICFNQVENFYSFKKFCKETDSKLQYVCNTNISLPHVEIKQENGDEDYELIENDYPKACSPSNSFDSDYQPLSTQRNCFKNNKRKYVKKKRPETYCKTCHLDYKQKDKYLEHHQELHGFKDGEYVCFGCKRKFQTRKTRMGHELNFCKKLKKGYFCIKCERYLPKRSMYESHIVKHMMDVPIELPENIFKCRKCKILFKARESLDVHNEECHGKKKHYVCEQCGREFKRMDYLNKHMLIHTGLKKHICPHCGYRAAQKSSLNVHLRKHTGDKPYSCDQCSLKCISSSNLIAHKLRHAGVKKYECGLCPKKFGYKASLEEHISSTHDRVKSFTCDVCNTNYARVGGLRRHMRLKHNKRAKIDMSTPTNVTGSIANNLKVTVHTDVTYIQKEVTIAFSDNCKKADDFEGGFLKNIDDVNRTLVVPLDGDSPGHLI